MKHALRTKNFVMGAKIEKWQKKKKGSLSIFFHYEPTDAHQSEKATKADDAKVSTYLWDNRIAYILG